jgi:hypothetical protein
MDFTRQYTRTNLAPGRFISFRIGGKSFSGLPLVSLGTGGCGLQADPSLLERVGKFRLVDEVRFAGLDLPDQPLCAKVVWVAGDDPACVGLEFTNLAPEYGGVLERLVLAIREGGRKGS